jgi:hypothetical protein
LYFYRLEAIWGTLAKNLVIFSLRRKMGRFEAKKTLFSSLSRKLGKQETKMKLTAKPS